MTSSQAVPRCPGVSQRCPTQWDSKTGKELLTNQIHTASERRGVPLSQSTGGGVPRGAQQAQVGPSEAPGSRRSTLARWSPLETLRAWGIGVRLRGHSDFWLAYPPTMPPEDRAGVQRMLSGNLTHWRVLAELRAEARHLVHRPTSSAP